MYEYLKGEITELDPTQAVIECGGVGYACAISVYTFDRLKIGQTQTLYISETLRDEIHILYGFATKQERTAFELLTSVSGVGPSTARIILSTLSPEELSTVIASGNERQLKAVKGIGGKTAQRIIVDLKDKMGSLCPTALPTTTAVGTVSAGRLGDEAISALVALGYPQANAVKVVTQLLTTDPDMPLQNIIKQGLRMI